jgi:hypothetical protein
MSLTVISIQAVNRLRVTRPDARSGEDSKCLVQRTSCGSFNKRHRLSCFQPCFEALVGLHEVAATPWNAEEGCTN